MKTRLDLALKYREIGYNCAQAVACCYADLIKMDERDVFRALEGFGLGMGDANYVCGTVSAIVFIAGAVYSDGNLENPQTKHDTYDKVVPLINEFKKNTNTLICKDIKGIETGKPIRECNTCVLDACKIIEKYIFKDLFTE